MEIFWKKARLKNSLGKQVQWADATHESLDEEEELLFIYFMKEAFSCFLPTGMLYLSYLSWFFFPPKLSYQIALLNQKLASCDVNIFSYELWLLWLCDLVTSKMIKKVCPMINPLQIMRSSHELLFISLEQFSQFSVVKTDDRSLHHLK